MNLAMLFTLAYVTLAICKVMGKETKVQKKILDWLDAHGFWAFKTIVCNRSGIMDIICCSPQGRFIGIEVKQGNGRPSELQKQCVEEVVRRNGIAFVAWDLETVIYHLGKYSDETKAPKQATNAKEIDL